MINNRYHQELEAGICLLSLRRGGIRYAQAAGLSSNSSCSVAPSTRHRKCRQIGVGVALCRNENAPVLRGTRGLRYLLAWKRRCKHRIVLYILGFCSFAVTSALFLRSLFGDLCHIRSFPPLLPHTFSKIEWLAEYVDRNMTLLASKVAAAPARAALWCKSCLKALHAL